MGRRALLVGTLVVVQRGVIVAVAVNTLFFMMFEVWFKVPLHKGALDPLSFLGY